MFGFKVINQYEQGIVFRFGRALPDIRQPGLIWVNPITDRLRKVNMQITVAAVPGQEAITRDNVTLPVDAVVYYQVVRPGQGDHQRAGLHLRRVPGRPDLAAVSDRPERHGPVAFPAREGQRPPQGGHRRAHRGALGYPGGTGRGQGHLAARVDETLHVTAGRRRRERRAGIISADGEYQASKKLTKAAAVMAADPAALQLRLLQTVVEVAAEKNSTLVMPVPVELLRFFDRAARGPRPGRAPGR